MLLVVLLDAASYDLLRHVGNLGRAVTVVCPPLFQLRIGTSSLVLRQLTFPFKQPHAARFFNNIGSDATYMLVGCACWWPKRLTCRQLTHPKQSQRFATKPAGYTHCSSRVAYYKIRVFTDAVCQATCRYRSLVCSRREKAHCFLATAAASRMHVFLPGCSGPRNATDEIDRTSLWVVAHTKGHRYSVIPLIVYRLVIGALQLPWKLQHTSPIGAHFCFCRKRLVVKRIIDCGILRSHCFFYCSCCF